MNCATPLPLPGEPAKLAIYAAVAQVASAVNVIAKTRTNPQQGYQFRGIDDVLNHCHGPMTEAGIFAVPQLLDIQHEERTTRTGNAMMYARVRVKYTLFAGDGSNISAIVPGEAMDTGDKATGKAMSYAMKTALIQLFAIPTEGDNDTENQSPEVLAKIPSPPLLPSCGAATAAAAKPTQPATPPAAAPTEVFHVTGCNLRKSGGEGARAWQLYDIETTEGTSFSTFSTSAAKILTEAAQSGAAVEIESTDGKFDRRNIKSARLAGVAERPAEPAAADAAERTRVDLKIADVQANLYQHEGKTKTWYRVLTHNLGEFSCTNERIAADLSSAKGTADEAPAVVAWFIKRAKSNAIVAIEEIPF